MNTLKVGDKVKIRSDLVVGEKYFWFDEQWLRFVQEQKTFLWKEVVIENISCNEFQIVWWNGWFYNDAMIEPIQSSTVKTRPTYQRKAERSDGVLFEKEAIWWRTLKEIEESIKERKDSIKADEQLLRSHRSLFSKK